MSGTKGRHCSSEEHAFPRRMSFSSHVEPTQVLFEVMDLTNLRIIVEVDERDIHRIEVGNKGRFAPAGRRGS